MATERTTCFSPSRRRLLQALALCGLLPDALLRPASAAPSSILVSGYYERRGTQMDNRLRWRHPNGTARNELALDFRGHGLYPHPAKPSHVVVFARRPGRRLVEVDLATARITHDVSATPGRHFFGHGVFSADGSRLYTTENDYEAGRGMIGVRNGTTLGLIEEFPSAGIGPHDIRLLSDDQTLVVANGGILTHPDQPRRKLNLHAMRPDLTYLDRRDGRVHERRRLDDHQLSIRHLAVTRDDQVVAVQQYEGSRHRLPPLVMVHRPGQPPRLLRADDATQRRMDWYTASVAADSRSATALVTSPRGNLITLWDIEADRLIRSFDLRKPYGAALAPDGHRYAISCADGALFGMAPDGSDLRRLQATDDGAWDNHLMWIGSGR
ncbi:MAG: DUF1513 domain-containing protein [Gammaproteobacteria bacterium]|nr:DUF1513 domain-containing protein [Gammaproteobacteria bacterium]